MDLGSTPHGVRPCRVESSLFGYRLSMLSKSHAQETVPPQREDDAHRVAPAAPELPKGDSMRSKDRPAFRDCRGELVWLD